MFDPEKSTTPRQDRIAKRAEQAEKYAAISSDPETPWFLGKLAALEAFRVRPTRLDAWMARSTDNMRVRSQEIDERSRAEFQGAIGKLRRARAGEPEVVPASPEVMQMQFVSDQEAAAQQNHPDEPKQLEPPTE